jgi:hypothetical protein
VAVEEVEAASGARAVRSSAWEQRVQLLVARNQLASPCLRVVDASSRSVSRPGAQLETVFELARTF